MVAAMKARAYHGSTEKRWAVHRMAATAASPQDTAKEFGIVRELARIPIRRVT
jgi:hypothetical protein